MSRFIWEEHAEDLRVSGDLYYTWQYDIRWAAQELRDGGVLAPSPTRGARQPWRLASAR